MMENSSLRTPLGKVRGLGSAKDGTRTFWHQRVTAVANIPLIAFFIVFLVVYNGASYVSVVGFLSNPIVSVVMALVVLSVFVHMRIGMQVVIEDYVHGEAGKLALLILNNFFTL